MFLISNTSLSMYLFHKSRIHVITLYSSYVCVYYTSMLRCWHLIWILVRTDHPCLGVGCHNIETLTKLGCEIKDDLATDVILQSLPVSHESFIMNFYMNGIEKTVAELHGMLKIVEDGIKKNPKHMMMVQKENKKTKRWTSPKGKGKKKVSDEPSSSMPKIKAKSAPSPDEECFHCHKKGHWFRNCKKYLEEQKKKKKGSETSASGINVIEIKIAVSSSDSWVFDTGSMIHTCKLLQGLSLTRKFAKGKLDVRVSNGANVAVIAVGTFHLPLPSGLVLELNNFYCIPA
jgi:hypothetical protein